MAPDTPTSSSSPQGGGEQGSASQKTLTKKLRQIIRAVELERRFSKDEILRLYLNLAPYGGNIEGVRAASLAYFGREPKRLSLAEAALLVALPQSPEMRRPDRFAAAAGQARDRVLDRAQARGVITAEEAERAKAERVPVARQPFPMLAAHAAERAVAERPALAVHRLTLDARQQASLEALARERVERLDPRLSAAMLVIDNATGDVLAAVGSAGYMAAQRAGAIDMIHALRSPGSALKPFIYALAFESGLAHPETLVDDRPSRFGLYRPENFDLTFQGTVTARRALQQSLNIPAVELLSKIGPARLLARFEQAGAKLAWPKEAAPGLAIGLGGLGITPCRPDAPLCGVRPGRPRSDARLAPRDGAGASRRRHRRPGRGLVCGGHPSRRAAARERASRAHRVQDRHVLRLSAMPGPSASTAGSQSASGSGGPTAAPCRASSAARLRRRSCSTPMRGSA